jgi:predicted HD phosphohydrolase
MSDATAEELQAQEAADAAFAAALPARVLAHLLGLSARGVENGLPVDRLTHSLQTASRAHRDGRSDEYVVCCLLHDVGDLLAPYRHAEVAALMLEPFVSEENLFMIRHHALFQGYHFFHKLGFDRNVRERFLDHPHYAHAVAFSEYDQASFDPAYETLPLAHFEPMVHHTFSRPPKWAQAGAAGMTSIEISGLVR